MAPHKAQRAAHLFDLAPDPCFGKPQRLAQQFSQTRRWLRRKAISFTDQACIPSRP
jgi:hypothetical protein